MVATTPPPNKSQKGSPKPEGEPDWVTTDNRRFYNKLVNNPDLLTQIAEIIASNSGTNDDLAQTLVGLGFHKQDKTPLDGASMSRIKGVVKNLSSHT